MLSTLEKDEINKLIQKIFSWSEKSYGNTIYSIEEEIMKEKDKFLYRLGNDILDLVNVPEIVHKFYSRIDNHGLDLFEYTQKSIMIRGMVRIYQGEQPKYILEDLISHKYYLEENYK